MVCCCYALFSYSGSDPRFVRDISLDAPCDRLPLSRAVLFGDFAHVTMRATWCMVLAPHGQFLVFTSEIRLLFQLRSQLGATLHMRTGQAAKMHQEFSAVQTMLKKERGSKIENSKHAHIPKLSIMKLLVFKRANR